MLWELAFYINNLWFAFGSIYWFTQYTHDYKFPLVRYRWTVWRDDYTTQLKEGSRNVFISPVRILRKVKEQWHKDKSSFTCSEISKPSSLNFTGLTRTRETHPLCLWDLPQPALLSRTGYKKFFCSSLCESLCLTISCHFSEVT